MDLGEKKAVVDAEAYDPKELGELLPVYYKFLFPHKLFYKWLAYGNSKF